MIGQARGLLQDCANLGINQVVVPQGSLLASAGADVGESSRPGETLEQIQQALTDCRRCDLCQQRTNIVFGVGNPQARLLLVGEAPGREEDRQGEPFVGEAGRLLDRILFAMGLQRSEVYICNVMKCHPPENRDPAQVEMETCETFLKRQIQAIDPELIVTLGRFASQALLRDQTPISKMRGTWQEYQSVPLMPTFHPAYLLRNPSSKREVWEDMKQVMHRLHRNSG